MKALTDAWNLVWYWLHTFVLDVPVLLHDKFDEKERLSLGRILIVVLAINFLLHAGWISLAALALAVLYVILTR